MKRVGGTAQKVPAIHLAAYAAPGIPLALLISPFPALLMAFYAKHTEATTAGIATAILIARILNGLIDPPIGYLSDRTRSRLGPRKPWLIGGGLFSIFAFYVAYMPPDGAGTLWFAFGIISFYIAQSVIDTPYRTWSGEISADYAQRSRIAGAQTLAVLVGGVLALALPEILSLPAIGILKSSALDRDTMRMMGLIGMVLMPTAILIAVWVVPVGTVTRGESYGLLEMRTVFTRNGPFRRFIAADIVSAIGWAVTYALVTFLLDNYFGFGDKIVMFLLVATAAQILTIPICSRLATRFGKHRVYSGGQILNAILLPGYLLFPPDGQANFGLLLAFGALVSAMGTPNMMFPVAMLSDMADYDSLKTRQARSGIYFAMRTLLNPAGGAIGGAFGFYMLSIVGFDPSADVNSQAATWGMITTAIVAPMICFLVSGWLMRGYEITSRRHAAIRRVLEKRGVANVGAENSAVAEAGAVIQPR
ncbi:MAG: MFS transporter [Sphingomonadales bacterium]|nr:MFS transporter [Sphingomonadales bacterium]